MNIGTNTGKNKQQLTYEKYENGDLEKKKDRSERKKEEEERKKSRKRINERVADY